MSALFRGAATDNRSKTPGRPLNAGEFVTVRRVVPRAAAQLTGDERTIDLFLRPGIDLRRHNLSRRRDGFWRRFQGELDYLLSDARAAFLQKIKLALSRRK